MESSTPEQDSSKPQTQSILMAIGAAGIVLLTVVIAILLAARDFESTPAGDPTELRPLTVEEPTNTAVPNAEPTSTQLIETELATPSQLPTATEALPTNTYTPIPPTDTATMTPMPTATPLPTNTALPTATPCYPRRDWPVYYVQVGDTLISLANKTQTSAENLQLSNCLPNFNISVGQQIRLPFIPNKTPTPRPDIDLGTPTPTTPGGPSTELGG